VARQATQPAMTATTFRIVDLTSKSSASTPLSAAIEPGAVPDQRLERRRADVSVPPGSITASAAPRRRLADGGCLAAIDVDRDEFTVGASACSRSVAASTRHRAFAH
jgi:hypothetical protein